jgi:hypothetical protein
MHGMNIKLNLVRIDPLNTDTKPRRSFLNFREGWFTPQYTDEIKVLRRKRKKKKKSNPFDVTVGRLVNGRIDAIGLPNIVVFTVDRYSTVYSYMQYSSIKGMWNVFTLSSHPHRRSSKLSLSSRLQKQNPV